MMQILVNIIGTIVEIRRLSWYIAEKETQGLCSQADFFIHFNATSID